MKLTYNISLVCMIAATLLIVSCEDKELSPMPDFESGGLVKANIPEENSFFNLGDLNNAKVVMNLVATDKEGGSMVGSYEIYVSYYNATTDEATDTLLLATVSEFPSTYEVTASQLVDLFQLPDGLASLNGGDLFNFDMKVVMKDGREFTQQNSSDAVVQEPGSRGTFRYSAFVGCPFNAADMAGTYTLLEDSWEVAATGHTTMEVVAGPGEDQFTVMNVFGMGFDMVVDVNPASGVATVQKQETWDPGYWGFPEAYGRGYAASPAAQGSTVFSCVGAATFRFTYSVDAGTFGGVHTYSIKKN